jgi:hypothetical protein
MFEHFYHGSIRKLVVSFGSLFDEIYVSRKNADGTEEKKIKVPISYAPKEKFYRKIAELNQSGDRKSVESIVPRMAFEITSMVYDPSRKLNSLNKIYTTKDEKDKTFSYSYNEVPYTVEFNLNVMTRNIDDGYQIVEQILPYFTPDFTVSLNFNELYKKIDVPIVLNSVSSSEEYEGSLADERRMITHTLSFSAKSYVLGPIKQGGLIREIRLTFNELTGDS